MSGKRTYLFFALIVLVNVFLKLIYCNYSPFSYDEIISVKDTLLDFGHIKHEAEWDNNPPFYYYCLWVWHTMLPISELNSRLLSVIFASIAIGLGFLFAQKHFGNKTAFFSAALLTVSNFLTFYAQETRTYALVLLLVMISSFLFFKYVQKPGYANLLLLSFVNFLIIYSHYIAGLVLVAQYAMIFFYHKKNIKVYFLVQTLFIGLLVYLRFTKKQFLNIFNYNHKGDFWLKKATFNDLLTGVSEIFSSKIVACICVLVLLVFCFNYVRNNSDKQFKEVKTYCLLLGLVSILLLFFLGTFKALFLPRYLVFCVPFATILIVYQLTELKWVGVGVVCTLIAIQLPGLKIKKESGMDYRSIASLIKTNKKDNDHVVINTRDNLILFEYYYNKNNFLRYRNIDSLCGTEKIYGMNELNDLRGLNYEPNSHVFLIQSFHKLDKTNNPMEEYLASKASKIYTTNFYKGVEVNIFKAAAQKP